MSEADIVPRLKFRDNFGVLYHVVSVIDDNGTQVVVFRAWRKRWRVWEYSATRMALLLRRINENHYRVAR